MKKLLKGVTSFQEEVYPRHRDLFAELAAGQRPEALLITCADSRIDPGMLTQTRPGDLFICRNAGNIVPPYGEAVGGVSATIEYAVAVLRVRDVIVCGHSDCGVMKGVLNPDSVASLRSVKAWLHYGDTARAIVRESRPRLTGGALLRALTEQNVLAQLTNLRTHPSVAARLAKGDLRLHGWIYDIESGRVSVFKPPVNRFVPLRKGRKTRPD